MQAPRKCPECGGEIFYDVKTGEYICTLCGLVVAERIKGLLVAPEMPRYVPRPPVETLYHIEPEVADKQLRKLEWWRR